MWGQRISRACRVAVVIDHPSQHVAPGLATNATAAGLQVDVVYFSLAGARHAGDRGFNRAIKWDIPILDLHTWTLLGGSLSALGGQVRTVLAISRALARRKYDLVVFHGYGTPSMMGAALMARASRIPTVVCTDATTLVPRDERGLRARLKPVVVPAIYRQYDGVFVASTRARTFIASIGVQADRIFLVPNAVDGARLVNDARATSRAETRRKWGVPEHGSVALFCGKLVRWKRPWDLIDAADRIPDLTVVFCGDGPERAQLTRRVENLGIAQRVRFLGFVNQAAIGRVYAAADLLVLPSEFEPFGLVISEACALGLPIVASRACGAVDDLVVHGENGFVVDVGDVGALTRSIEAVANRRNLRDRMGRASTEHGAAWNTAASGMAFAQACTSLHAKAVAIEGQPSGRPPEEPTTET